MSHPFSKSGGAEAFRARASRRRAFIQLPAGSRAVRIPARGRRREDARMASEQLKAVLELVGGADLGTLTLQERRALMASAGAPLREGTQVDPVDANGVPAEWVVAAGVTVERVVLHFHGGAYHLGSPARLRGLLALLSAAAQARVLSGGYRPAPQQPLPPAAEAPAAA